MIFICSFLKSVSGGNSTTQKQSFINCFTSEVELYLVFDNSRNDRHHDQIVLYL